MATNFLGCLNEKQIHLKVICSLFFFSSNKLLIDQGCQTQTGSRANSSFEICSRAIIFKKKEKLKFHGYEM